MSQYKVTKQLFLDVLPPASAIETHLGEYMPACPPGLYLPACAQPVLKPHERYYQVQLQAVTPAKEPLPALDLLDLKTIQGDVYDACNDQLVLHRRLLRSLTREPTVPVRGLAAISSAVDWMITDCSAWAKRPPLTLQEVLARHVRPEFSANETLLTQFSDFLLELRTDVRQFIGDDVWVVHFHRQAGFEIVLEKTIDFRILDWERRTNTGEWK